jgi:dolichol-phosphate mannosyltransferase
LAVKIFHAPLITLTAMHQFTDTTNAFRAYSKKYLMHPLVQPLRDVFMTYELLAYLSVRASQLRLKVIEVPVTRAYPKGEKTPTKISFFKGNYNLMKILFKNLVGLYKP